MRIVVKLPDQHFDQVCAIPFLYKLDEIFHNEEIHLIVKKKYSEYLAMIPLTLYVHQIDDELKNPIEVHRVAAGLNIAAVDLFFSLTETLTDNSFGKWLRSEKSIGFGEGFKSIVLDIKMPKPSHLHICDQYLKLLDLIPKLEHETPEDLESRSKFDKYVRSKELEPIVPDAEENPYLVMNLPYDIEKNCFSYEWIEFFEFIKDERIFFISDQCPRSQFNILINDFILRLPEKNKYFSYSLNISEVSSLIAHSKGFISPDSFLCHISSFLGTKTICLFDQNADKRSPIYTQGDCYIVSKSELLLTHGLQGKVVSEFEIGQIFDIACDFFSLDTIEE